jgi:hypothetical protein
MGLRFSSLWHGAAKVLEDRGHSLEHADGRGLCWNMQGSLLFRAAHVGMLCATRRERGRCRSISPVLKHPARLYLAFVSDSNFCFMLLGTVCWSRCLQLNHATSLSNETRFILWKGTTIKGEMCFTNGYYVAKPEKECELVCTSHEAFADAIVTLFQHRAAPIFGVQGHPERSPQVGVQLLNFLWERCRKDSRGCI